MGNEKALADALAAKDTALQTARSAILELGEKPELTDDESKRFEDLEAEYKTLETEHAAMTERAERMAKLRAAASEAEALEAAGDEPEDESTSRNQPTYVRPGRPAQRAKVDPFKDYATTRSMPVGDVVTRARQSVEQAPDHLLTDTQRSHVERAIRDDRQGTLARHIMAGQNPDYVSAFDKIIGGDTQLITLTEAERSAVAFTNDVRRGILEGTNSAGGFLVPPYLDPTVIHTAEDSVNPIRQLVDQKTINGPKYAAPTVGAITAGYVGEAVEIGESTPAFGKFEVIAQKAGAYAKISSEADEDTTASSELPGLLQEAKDEWEAREFLLGDGAAGHIRGILTALIAADAAASAGQKLIVATAAAGNYAVNDIYTVLGMVPARYRQNLKWLAAYEFYLRARTLAGNNNLGAFWTDLNGDNPPNIAGKPTYEASQMPSAAVGTNYTANQVVALAGDFKQAYLIVDRRGMVVQYDPMVKGPNGRPTGEYGWYATWRTGGDMRLPRALRGLKSS